MRNFVFQFVLRNGRFVSTGEVSNGQSLRVPTSAMHVTLTLLLLAPFDASGALPRTNSVIGAAVLAATLAGCSAPPEFHDCLSDEIARRTLKLKLTDGACSAVLTGPRTIRTASHCFWSGADVVRITTGDGRILSGDFRVRASPRGFDDDPDQAEITADRDLDRVDDLPVVKAEEERAIILVGYPKGGDLLRRLARVTRRYHFPSGLVVYALQGDDGWTGIPGESGGPAFAARGCKLALVGTIDSRSTASTFVQAPVAKVVPGLVRPTPRGTARR